MGAKAYTVEAKPEDKPLAVKTKTGLSIENIEKKEPEEPEPICPLLGRPCVKDGCNWFKGSCSVNIIAEEMSKRDK